MTPNRAVVREELNQHWEVLAEPIQILLRKAGQDDAFEKIKTLTRGSHITRESLHEIIIQLPLLEKDRQWLLKLTPETYIGLAPQLPDLL